MLQSSSVQSWQNKQALVFILDESLLEPSFNHQFWQEIIPKTYANLHSISLSQAQSLISTHKTAVQDSLEGYSIDYWEKTLAINLLGLAKQYSHLIRLNKYSEKFLFYIHNLAQRPKCYLVSNEHPDYLSFQLQLTGLECFFDVVTSSHEIGMPKQKKEFWPQYFKYLNLNTNNTVLLGGDSIAVRSAFDSGLEIIANKKDTMDPKHSKIQYINNLSDLLPNNLTSFDMIYAR